LRQRNPRAAKEEKACGNRDEKLNAASMRISKRKLEMEWIHAKAEVIDV